MGTRSTPRAAGRLLQFVATATRGAFRPVVPGAVGRAEHLRVESLRVAEAIGLEVQAEGHPRGAQLIVCNHLGYLDVVALATLGPKAFVSKAEVRRWPGIGHLAARAGTIFLDRERRSAVAEAADQIRQRVDQGVPVVVFPEGTSSDGSTVLPFHPSLFEVAIRESWRIAPAAIAYELPEGGDPATDVAYWGSMTFLPHFLGMLSLPRVVARIRFGATRVAAGDRKHLARQMHAAVAGLHELLVQGDRMPVRHPMAPFGEASAVGLPEPVLRGGDGRPWGHGTET